ncbi:M2 family metallopeptidase, partial [Pseudoalteromonas ruthenica]|uniref:M2 family metallopeptidase n=1 Tax=Pseudoalteromonas ruthenica TaxID=151081 RepID=UPI00127B4299
MSSNKLTATDAKEFLANTEQQLAKLYEKSCRAAFIYANFITHDTAEVAAAAKQEVTEPIVRLAIEAARFADLELDADSRRKLDKLKLAL